MVTKPRHDLPPRDALSRQLQGKQLVAKLRRVCAQCRTRVRQRHGGSAGVNLHEQLIDRSCGIERSRRPGRVETSGQECRHRHALLVGSQDFRQLRGGFLLVLARGISRSRLPQGEVVDFGRPCSVCEDVDGLAAQKRPVLLARCKRHPVVLRRCLAHVHDVAAALAVAVMHLEGEIHGAVYSSGTAERASSSASSLAMFSLRPFGPWAVNCRGDGVAVQRHNLVNGARRHRQGRRNCSWF